tara:strand:+ start:54 stop:362 length:309 start_codon:yes stop_codon:yes gene_type:complete
LATGNNSGNEAKKQETVKNLSHHLINLKSKMVMFVFFITINCTLDWSYFQKLGGLSGRCLIAKKYRILLKENDEYVFHQKSFGISSSFIFRLMCLRRYNLLD